MSPRTANMTLTRSGIRIGIATMPHQRIHATQDAIRLQAAMLRQPRSPDWYAGAVMAACALALTVMAFAGWLPGAAA